jgi:hypothetical protein
VLRWLPLSQVLGVIYVVVRQTVSHGTNKVTFPSFQPQLELEMGFSLAPQGPPNTPPDPVIPLDIARIASNSA